MSPSADGYCALEGVSDLEESLQDENSNMDRLFSFRF